MPGLQENKRWKRNAGDRSRRSHTGNYRNLTIVLFSDLLFRFSCVFRQCSMPKRFYFLTCLGEINRKLAETQLKTRK
ncbi:Protein CBG25964 [Caenorhabditis briggsae]|uniref:Protein CBG25964 n=1 Tax=Caenorhabditis briggsae TaxID=6238 RepID=B6IKR4_CAEBR|nr:Protein CBG25964 [Caenorhabditis briggsae]CAS00494.1 Protein CBG25964 [Caenorhabditis briggsae]